MRGVFVAGLVLLLSGCGFQLRGAYSLPYESIYLATGGSVIGAGLKRQRSLWSLYFSAKD